MPTRPAALAHWLLRCSVGVTTVTASTVRSASSSAAIRRANVVLPAPGVATARKSSLRRRRYSTSALRCQARRFGLSCGFGRGGMDSLRSHSNALAAVPVPRRRPEGVYRCGSPPDGCRTRVSAVLYDVVVEVLAHRAHGESLRVTGRDPELPAQRADRGALDHR